MKTSRAIIGLCAAGLLLGAFSTFFPRSYYIAAPEGQIRVPKEIVNGRDCNAFGKFLESLARPGFVPDVNCVMPF